MTEPLPPRVQAAESRRTMRYLFAASSLGAWAARNAQRTKAEDLARLEIAVVELSYDDWRDVLNAINGCIDTDLQDTDGIAALFDALDQYGLMEERA
jgi:hypothetical protein